MCAKCYIYKVSLFDEDHTELYIKHIPLSIYHLSCQVEAAGAVKCPLKAQIHSQLIVKNRI